MSKNSTTTPGTLYMLPCPIADTSVDEVLPVSNLHIMSGLDYYIVEDIRSARRFISKCKLGKPIDSLTFAELNEHTRPEDVELLLSPLLNGIDAGMLSEAGVPGIADPGADIAALCHKHGVKVKPLVGPSSIMMALMASGLNGQSFAFNGYLPVKPDQRVKAIRFFEKRAHSERQSQIFIEAPYRNGKLAADIVSSCSPSTMLCIACDISGQDELIRTLPVSIWKKTELPDLHKRPAIFIIL